MRSESDRFEDFQALLDFQRRRRASIVVFALVAGAVVAFAPPLALVFEGSLAVPIAGAAVLSAAALLTIRRLVRLRRCVWCVQLTPRCVRFLLVDGRERETAWRQARRVELDADGLHVVGVDGTGREHRDTVPGDMPAFPALGHRAVSLAEAHGCPVCIDGRPWQFLDLERLYPFLRAEAAGDA